MTDQPGPAARPVAPLDTGYGSPGYRAYLLGALVAIYALSVVDRVLLALVQEQVKRELLLTDFQLGLLGGPAFVVCYSLLSVPIARLAERYNRITILAIGTAVWSAATAASGFAQNFTHLLWARIAVGSGEAACVPPSHSSISDAFPARRRALAFAIYGLAIPIGTLAASFGVAWIAKHYDWRTAFIMLGLPGLLAAFLLKLTVRDPARRRGDVRPVGFTIALKTLLRKPTYRHVCAGGALLAIYSFAMGQFLPSYLIRYFQLDTSTAAAAFGVIFGISVAVGTFLGGFLTDRLSPRYPRIITWLPAVGLLIATPLFALALLQGSAAAAIGILIVAPVFHLFWFAPLFTVAQNVAPPDMRATASALLLTIFNMIGYGIGPPLVGGLADHFGARRLAEQGLDAASCQVNASLSLCTDAAAHGLRLALLIALVFMIWAAIHFLLAGRSLDRDRVD
ncbi:MAG TPA: MFS transporter [Allosphingosinicella sp.]|nr:MFS transporter [Allosphingosinicella sp.]